MRRRGLLALLLLAALLAAWPSPRRPAPDAVTRGAALGLFASDAGYDYQMMLHEIRARGATDVLLVIPLVQSDVSSCDLDWSPTAPPEALRRTLQQARAAGLRAGVMPIVRLADRTPDQWRGVIAPQPHVDDWFARYTALLDELLAIASEEGAARFGVGSELGSLEPYAPRWRQLIAHARSRFDGALFYAANWDRVEQVPFWDAVDFVGVSGYFELAAPGEPLSPGGLAAAWADPHRRLAGLSAAVGRPILFAEVGYPAHALAAARPWDHAADAAVDVGLQADLWRAFCAQFRDEPAVTGFYAWNWFGAGGPRDRGYSPRGKPAAAVLQRCWSDGVGAADALSAPLASAR